MKNSLIAMGIGFMASAVSSETEGAVLQRSPFWGAENGDVYASLEE